jgi:hypothetical protein
MIEHTTIIVSIHQLQHLIVKMLDRYMEVWQETLVVHEIKKTIIEKFRT